MSEITIEETTPAEDVILMQWLDDAAGWNIDVRDVRTIDAAYQGYFDHVVAQDEKDREDPTQFVAMIGFALGQWLALETILEWRIITDENGRDLGLALPDHSSFMFPSDFVADAWNEARREWLTEWASDLKAQLLELS